MKLGLTNGCFDGLHEGHKFFLRECLLHCDKLIVLVNDDIWMRRFKKPPMWNIATRVKAARSLLRAWDEVESWTGYSLGICLEMQMPDVVFRGWDQADDVALVPVMRIARHGDYSSTALRA